MNGRCAIEHKHGRVQDHDDEDDDDDPGKHPCSRVQQQEKISTVDPTWNRK